MDTQRISVFELNKYWSAVDAFSKGGDDFNIVGAAEMPLWIDICSGLPWRSHCLTGGYFSKKRHGYCGVYRLIGLATEGELKNPAILDRICGQDPTGTLYIGEASRLNERLNDLRSGSHHASHLPAALRQKFPPTKLAIALLFTKPCTEWIEDDLIKAYINSFGDTPPLNYRIRR